VYLWDDLEAVARASGRQAPRTELPSRPPPRARAQACGGSRAYTLPSPLSHVFVSYVREDSADVDRLVRELAGYGVDVWLDRNEIEPGRNWRDAIRHAVQEGAFFLACFSAAFASRDKGYMNEELALAIEEIRQRPRDRIWFIPVLLTESRVPDWPIRPGETLRDLQWVDLFHDWEVGVRQIATVVSPEAVFPGGYVMPELDDRGWERLLHHIASDSCLLFLGPGINAGVPSADADIANALVAYGHLETDSKDLSRVLRLFSNSCGRGQAAACLAKVLGPPPEFDHPEEMHAALAQLPLSLYFTTNYDTHMEEALRSRGRMPVQMTWSSLDHKWTPVSDRGRAKEPEPAPDTPWVVHLRGAANRPESLILTLAEQFRLLGTLLYHQTSLPRQMQYGLWRSRRNLYVFLGHRPEDWTTELLSESLEESADDPYPHGLMVGTHDLTPELLVPHMNALRNRPLQHLSNYFDKLGFPLQKRIPITQFVDALRTRCLEAFPDRRWD